ncbi:MAG TPA: type II secretion system protein [Polyangiaceae bacterium]
MTRVAGQRAFTLLEVLVAIAILGLGLTVILGSQVGLFTNASRGEHLTVATNLARCKMGELEVKLLTYGYQLTDETDDGPCCSGDDDGNEGYRCSWKVERVMLPELPLSGADAGANPGGDGGLDLGPIGMLAGLNPTGSQNLNQSLGDKATPTDLAKTLGNAPSPMSLAPMMMSLVYPTLKPMLEASIRKVSVTVAYKEGKFSRELAVTQYVTNPQQGQLDPTVAGTGGGSGLGALGGLLPGLPGAAPGAGIGTGFGSK